MNIHEYQAKNLLTRYGLPIPIGFTYRSMCKAEECYLKIGPAPWVMKCQVHAGKRSKIGGVKVVRSQEEICDFFKKWIGNRMINDQTNAKGQLVDKILIESFSNVTKELYLGIAIDRNICCIVFIVSTEGGISIEQILTNTPHLIYKIILDPLIGPQPYQGRELAFKIGLIGKQVDQFNKIFMGLSTMFLELDLELAEINPLAITKEGDLICLDAKIIADDSALFRQPELKIMRDFRQEDELEVCAVQSNLNYVTMDGNIGCIVNGSGLAMGMMDVIKTYGAKPANFLDIGGDVTKQRIIKAFGIILSDKKVKVVIINIFGGIVRCDLIAEGIIDAVYKFGISIPIIVRLEGNNASIGIKLLTNKNVFNIILATSLLDAIQQVVAVIKE